MRIIIESEIVEDNDAEILQDFDGSSLDVFADDVSTFLITQITISLIPQHYSLTLFISA